MAPYKGLNLKLVSKILKMHFFFKCIIHYKNIKNTIYIIGEPYAEYNYISRNIICLFFLTFHKNCKLVI